MSTAFRAAISELWASLAMPEPVFGEDASIVLAIENDSVSLSESADGRCILVTSIAGRVSADPVLRAMQIRDILLGNLATISTHRAAVSIDDEFGLAEPPVVVTGVFHYAGRSSEPLIGIIEDVLALAQTHAAALRQQSSERPSPAAVRTQMRESDEDFALIFRP